MARIAAVPTVVFALIHPAFAQGVQPYSFLPNSTRPEFRAQLEDSGWMRRMNSAAGWVVVQEARSEVLEQPDVTGSNQSCRDRAVYYSGSDVARITSIGVGSKLTKFLPGNIMRVALRGAEYKCTEIVAGPLIESFLQRAAEPSEFPSLSARKVETGLNGQHFDWGDLGIQPATDGGSVYGAPRWIDRFEISESDSRLKPDTRIRIGINVVSPRGSRGVFGNSSSDMDCTLRDWVSVGAGEDALPFQAARLDCSAVLFNEWPDGAGAELTPDTYRGSSEASWIVPELNLSIDIDRKRYKDWTIKQERPGEWRLTIPDRQPNSISAFDLLILSPEAAARYPALRE